MPLAALFVVACGSGSDSETNDADAPAHVTAVFPNPPPIGLPPPPIPVPSPPKITAAPQNAVVGDGGGVRFSVGAVGFGPFTYRWYKNGVALNGSATVASYTIPAAAPADAATYTVRVTDTLGRASTASAVLQVVSGWAQVSGRAAVIVPSAPLQPSLTICGRSPQQPHVAYVGRNATTGLTELVVKAFDGAAWTQVGNALNATPTGTPSDPSIACVVDGSGSAWPVVAWSEGLSANSARGIHVRYWTGTAWQSAGDALNLSPGSLAIKPVLRVPPFDPVVGNVPTGGITRRAALAWIENGAPTLLKWNNGWQVPMPGGAQISGAAGATDIALKIDLEFQNQYPPVVAWIQFDRGARRPYAAVHTSTNAGASGGWTRLGDAASFDPQMPPAGVGNIAIATGRIGLPALAIPLVLWSDGAGRVRSYFYSGGDYQQLHGLNPWVAYGSFAPVAPPKAISLDGNDLGGVLCDFGDLPSFGLAVSDTTGFEVRHSVCGRATTANWVTVRPRHNVALDEVSLRMGSATDPLVAGTRPVSGGTELAVWKYYD